MAEAIAILAGERFAAVVETHRSQAIPVLEFWRNQVMRIAHAYERDSDEQINFGRALAGEPDLLPVWSAEKSKPSDRLPVSNWI